MRNFRRLISVAALTATAVTIVVVPGTALAVTGGAPHPVACTFVSEATGLTYEGYGQVVNTPGGRNTATCAGSLIAGQTPVSQTIRSTFFWNGSDCWAVETTRGEFRLFCVD